MEPPVSYSTSIKYLIIINKSIFEYINNLIDAKHSKLSYLVFLLLFSYVVLCNYYPIHFEDRKDENVYLEVSIFELILIIWVLSFFLDEIVQYFSSYNRRKSQKARLFNWKNFIDYSAIVLFFSATFLRYFDNEESFLWAR